MTKRKRAKRRPEKQLDLIPKCTSSKRGGVREGAGRPVGEGSTVVRVPNGCLVQVRLLIEAYRSSKKREKLQDELDRAERDFSERIRRIQGG